MLSLIVAVADNGVIGKDNGLIWRIPKDLQYFKEKTIGKKIIMGRKTFESFPRLLPGREHIVITRDQTYQAPKEVKVIHDLKQVTPYIDLEEEVFLIGGGELYHQLFHKCNKLYITWVHHEFCGDVFFPIEKIKDFVKVASKEELDETSGIKITFSIYEKRN
ncbi:MAG: dihydrofolate reductase [Epulopiscium sp.]|nr:dihydrofolate reductase [Candidatus Epulonipiscium sp.]